MISIIVPAHNEQSVITRCLQALTEGAMPGELEVIVACNGCTDRTAEIARAFGEPVKVIDIRTASKTAALNAGDARATGFPRIYVDADVGLNVDAVRRIVAVLERGEALMATPELSMDLSNCSWIVRSYYRVWASLPYNRDNAGVGTGVYALSRAGRARFHEFPPVLGDDGFVRALFVPRERATVAGATSHVRPPRTAWGLVKTHTRTRLGHYQLLQADLPLVDIAPQASRHFLSYCLKQPRLWKDLPVYVALNLLARHRARRQLRAKRGLLWERDNSSRQAS